MLTGALAHAGEPLRPHDLWRAWAAEPLTVIALALLVAAYLHGRARAAGRRRDPWRDRCFAGAIVALAVALVSPLDPLSGSLASAHMVQHVLIVLVAAPLLAWRPAGPILLAGSPVALRRATARGRRTPLVRSLLAASRQPAAVWLLHVATLWFWHASVPYDAALRSDWIHAAEHASFAVTAVLFWRVVLSPRTAVRAPYAVGLILVFAMALQSVFLSALLTFATGPWYDAYAGTTTAWGFEPLADQQLAGVIMWVPAGLVHLGVGLGLLVAWLRASEVEPALAPRRPPPAVSAR